MKLRISLVVLCCVLSILIGVALSRENHSDSAATKRTKPLIGLSMDTLKEERWQRDQENFVKRANALGAEVLVESANSDDTRQIKDVDSLISLGVDALVIIPHDGAAMATAVAKAHEAGIPVMAYDRLITGCDLDLYMAFDVIKVGELQAQYLTDNLKASGPGKKTIVRILGSKSDHNSVLLKDGQDKVLAPLIASGAIEVIHEDWAQDWKPENAKKITNAAITKVKMFDGILASNDGTAGGAIQALIEEGLAGKVMVTGQDADLAACQRIVAGTQLMTIYKPLSLLAEQAADVATKLAKRRPVVATSAIDNGMVKVPAVLLDMVAVGKDNMTETVIKDGFHSEADVYTAEK